MNLPELKYRLKQHRWLSLLLGCPYPARPWTKAVKHLLGETGPETRILEIGAGNRKRRPDVINLELAALPHVDVIADAHTLPFRTASLDLVLSEAVLEHVRHPAQIVAEMWRVLKPGGIVAVAVPFLQGFHAAPHDYYRFTVAGLEVLMDDFEKIESGVCAGSLCTLHWIGREWIGQLASFGNLWVGKLISLLVGWLTYPLVLLDPLMLKWPHPHLLASAVYFVGRKPEKGSTS